MLPLAKVERVIKRKLIVYNTNGLNFFLPFLIFLRNIVNFYYICIEQKEFQIIKELVLLLCYSSLLFSPLVPLCLLSLYSIGKSDQDRYHQKASYLYYLWVLAGFFLSLVSLLSKDSWSCPLLVQAFRFTCLCFCCWERSFEGKHQKRQI